MSTRVSSVAAVADATGDGARVGTPGGHVQQRARAGPAAGSRRGTGSPTGLSSGPPSVADGRQLRQSPRPRRPGRRRCSCAHGVDVQWSHPGGQARGVGRRLREQHPVALEGLLRGEPGRRSRRAPGPGGHRGRAAPSRYPRSPPPRPHPSSSVCLATSHDRLPPRPDVTPADDLGASPSSASPYVTAATICRATLRTSQLSERSAYHSRPKPARLAVPPGHVLGVAQVARGPQSRPGIGLVEAHLVAVAQATGRSPCARSVGAAGDTAAGAAADTAAGAA